MKTSFSHEALNLSREKWAGFSMSFHEIFCFIFGKKLIDLIFFWTKLIKCGSLCTKTQLHHVCIRTKPKSLLWNHFLFKWKAESQWCPRPQFSIDPKYKQVCPPKGRKKIKITVIMYYVQFTQLPPPLGPPFFSYKVYLLSSPVCSVRIRQNPAKYNY